jgi:hypothetical protein
MRAVFVLALVLAGCANGSSNAGGGGGGGGGGAGSDGGPAIDGGSDAAMTSNGLTFAIVGDTRPPSEDDTADYPTAIITTIFQDIEAVSPKPAFVIATGDYQFADPSNSEQQPQIDLYMGARQSFTGAFWPAMGNHECTGDTASNCGPGNSDGVTANMTVFVDTMLTPIGQTQPYYTETVTASDSSWTAKFIFTACNAWDATQSSWLSSQLQANSATYTFIIRHESAADMEEADCAVSQTLIGSAYTLLIVGHTHEYSHVASSKELVNGLGGAPLTSGTQYGYTIINRNADGSLAVTTYDYSNGSTIDSFKIDAAGTPAS